MSQGRAKRMKKKAGSKAVNPNNKVESECSRDLAGKSIPSC